MASPIPSDTIISKNPISSGGNIDFTAGSGTLVSGVLQPLGGPWYVETQTLDIYYVRVPAENAASSVTTTLTGSQTADTATNSTYIAYYAVANYDTVVQYQNYSTSAFQQPQLFDVNAASGDINGVNYGNITASTMGPMGNIQTTQPFMRRTPYTGASSQPLISRQAVGSNMGAFSMRVNDANNNVVYSGVPHNLSEKLYDLGWWKDQGCQPGTARTGFPIAGIGVGSISTGQAEYLIPGAFSTTKETLADIQVFLRNVGLKITNTGLASYPVCELGEVFGQFHFPIFDQGFVEYDINRHG
jgi:hypothetical protein